MLSQEDCFCKTKTGRPGCHLTRVRRHSGSLGVVCAVGLRRRVRSCLRLTRCQGHLSARKTLSAPATRPSARHDPRAPDRLHGFAPCRSHEANRAACGLPGLATGIALPASLHGSEADFSLVLSAVPLAGCPAGHAPATSGRTSGLPPGLGGGGEACVGSGVGMRPQVLGSVPMGSVSGPQWGARERPAPLLRAPCGSRYRPGVCGLALREDPLCPAC